MLSFLTLWAAFAAAQEGVVVPKPGAKELCPVCGMLVSKYPNWVAVVRYRDGHAHFFDGAKDMFKYLHDYARYAPGHRKEDIAGIHVTEFYGLGKMDAHQAFYVIGSDVPGPMGHEFVPLATRADAEEFFKDHKGKQILTFEQVSAALIERVDDGKF
ncbi:MAG: nitrous oxide reductase accessory protein NosL [Nitrosomonadales bacterium]|nr:nitrous oxide reductase accessory protein NosL [Nitrosomonadales bacterium]